MGRAEQRTRCNSLRLAQGEAQAIQHCTQSRAAPRSWQRRNHAGLQPLGGRPSSERVRGPQQLQSARAGRQARNAQRRDAGEPLAEPAGVRWAATVGQHPGSVRWHPPSTARRMQRVDGMCSDRYRHRIGTIGLVLPRRQPFDVCRESALPAADPKRVGRHGCAANERGVARTERSRQLSFDRLDRAMPGRDWGRAPVDRGPSAWTGLSCLRRRRHILRHGDLPTAHCPSPIARPVRVVNPWVRSHRAAGRVGSPVRAPPAAHAARCCTRLRSPARICRAPASHAQLLPQPPLRPLDALIRSRSDGRR